MKKTKNKKLMNNTLMLYIMTFATYFFPLITFPYLTRVLEPDVYGVVTYLTATATFFQLFVDYGFDLSGTKEIAENQKDKKQMGKIVGSVLQAKMGLAVISLIVYTVVVFLIPITRENLLLSYLYIGTVVLSVFLPDFLFRGIEKMSIITNRFLISKTITTLLTFVVVQNKTDVIWVPILNILGSIVAIILTWYHINKKMQIKIYFSTLKEAVVKIKTSTVYFLSTFATTAFGIANTFMLGVMEVPLNEVAYWAVSYNLINMGQSLYTPIINSLYPHMIARRDFKLVKKILLILMPLIFITIIIVFFLSETLITLFAGTEYFDAILIFKLLLPVLFFSFPAMLIGFPVLGAVGKVKETTVTTILSSFFHIMGLVALIITKNFTLINIAILRSCTEFILFTTRSYYLFKFKKLFKSRDSKK